LTTGSTAGGELIVGEFLVGLADEPSRIREFFRIDRGELLGDLSDELRAKLAGSEAPVVFTPYRSPRVGAER